MSTNQAKLSTRQLQELRDAFNIFDRDKNGTISIAELKQVLVALNLQPTDKVVRKLMKDMDVDRSGSVDFDEFAKMMTDIYSRKFTEDEMRQAFKCFDRDNSGYITVDELNNVLRRMNQRTDTQTVHGILHKIDANQDGRISYEEFKHLLQEI